MICLIQVPQIIGLRVSGGPLRRKHGNHKIHLTTWFTDLFHRGCLITQNFQRVADDCFDLWFANRDSGFAGLSNAFDSISVPPHVLERLAERCRVQADAVLVETPARPDILSDPAERFRGHGQHETTLKSLKRLKQGDASCHE